MVVVVSSHYGYAAKSNHKTLVHSCGKLWDLCRCGLCRAQRLDSGSHFRSVIEVREHIGPRAIDLEMLFAILDQMVHASAGMVTGPLVVDICKGPLNGIRSWAVGGQIEQLEAGMGRQPLLHLSGVVNLGIVGHTREVGESRRRVGPVERLEQVPEEARAFALPHAVLDGPGADIQRPSQVALLVGAWGHDLHLRPLGHPLITDLRQQTNIQLIGKEQGHADPHLLKG